MVWRRQLARLSALCLVLVNPTHAVAADEPAAMRTVPAAIPAQPLPQALAAFSAATHLQLVYVSQLALRKMSPGTPAGLPLAASLAQLLDGTGLNFLFLNDRTVKLFEVPREARAPRSSRVATGSDSGAADALDEVVVSATKRDEILSTLPMSISVLAPEDMAASGIQSIGGIAAVTTGMEYDFSSQYGPGILTNIAIRGISSDKGDATTGIYVDDIPLQSPHSTFGTPYPVTFDLAQVEVLRGPQGVLFGRGAEGGAIRYVTTEPSTTLFSQLYRFEVATTDHGGTTLETGAAAGGPLVDGVLGARVSVWYRHDGGYVNRIDPLTGAVADADANRSASRAVRVAMAFEPNDALRMTPSFSYQSIDLHDSPVVFEAPPAYAGGLDNGKLLRQPAADDLMIGSLTVQARAGSANLTAITSYIDRTAAAAVDTTNVAGATYFGGFGNPLGPAFPSSYADAVPTLITTHQIQFSQEVRLASRAATAPLKWLAGIFYSRLRQDSTQDTYLIAAPTNPGILIDDHNDTTEVSAFGQARWSLNSNWDLGAGMRVGWLENHGFALTGGFATAGTPPVWRTSQHETLPPTPRFDVAYQPDGRNLYYAAIAKGFRAGGGGGQSARCGNSTTPTSFGPDSVWSFELGAKNQVLDRRLRLDASVYDIHWNGIQERLQDACGNSFTTNAGTARSRGFDFGADASITDRFHLAAAIGYLDVRYTRTLKTADGQVIVDGGTVVGGAPSVPAPWSGTLSSTYQWPLEGISTAYLRAEEIAHSHNPGPFSELDSLNVSYDPRLTADPATYLLNLQLGLTRAGGNVRIFVNNAADARPMLQRYTDVPGSALVYAYTLRPRTVGLTGTWTF